MLGPLETARFNDYRNHESVRRFMDCQVYLNFEGYELTHCGEIDVPARREIWNNWIDAEIENGSLPEAARDLGLPDWLEQMKFSWNDQDFY